MKTARKITVEVPLALLENAQQASGTGVTRTVRTGCNSFPPRGLIFPSANFEARCAPWSFDRSHFHKGNSPRLCPSNRQRRKIPTFKPANLTTF
jgi:hypothetical protein